MFAIRTSPYQAACRALTASAAAKTQRPMVVKAYQLGNVSQPTKSRVLAYPMPIARVAPNAFAKQSSSLPLNPPTAAEIQMAMIVTANQLTAPSRPASRAWVAPAITNSPRNAKSVNMTGITIVPSGDGIQSNRTSAFIGDLPPHSEKAIPFEITPSKETDLTFNISYTCGMNAHETSYTIEIPLGTDKLAADPLINNIEVTSGSDGNTIAGDVSNAGLSDAYGVVVALESAADESGNPNQKYVIGTITSGDFSSFEITVPQNLKSVPLVILFKDSSGNQFSKNISIDTNQVNGGLGSVINGVSGGFPGGGSPPSGAPSGQSGSSGPSGRSNPMNPLSGMGSGMNSVPVMEILYGIGILLILVIIWKLWKRKTNGRKLKISFK